ncbi:MAG TPA: DUF3794 domain-containing protein [Epulopiscium sp.]|nr:DUF3794 domain-containing protein [Candidatus Epulonipiscium sp.]
MSVELVKKSLLLNKGTKRECAQVIKERDLIVPDGKPDMQKVLQMDGKLDIEQIEVQQDRIIYKGKVDIIILYVPENNPMTICTMKSTIPLEDFIIVEGVDKDHGVKLNYSIGHLHWNVLNERKINVKVIIQLEADATQTHMAEVVVGCNSLEPIQTRTQNVYFSKKSNLKEEKMILKDDLAVPSGKPSIGEILRTEITISDKEIRRTDEEIFYSGNLNIATLYKVQDDSENIEMMHHQIPFSSAIEYIREEDEEFYDCDLEISQQYFQIIPDLDGEDRILEIEAVIKAEASTIDAVKAEIINDIYCPGKNIEITDSTSDFMNLLHKADACIPKKETILFEETVPDNETIYSICMKPIVEDTMIKDNSLEINGVVEVKVIYTTQEATQKLASTSAVISFTQTIEVAGIDQKSIPVVTSKVEDIRILTQGKREVVVEFKICNKIEVYEKKSIYLLENVELEDINIEDLKKLPSMTIYTVKKGDSYWSIAKKYNTTLEEIKELNEIDLDAALYPGQKIMILKKVNY